MDNDAGADDSLFAKRSASARDREVNLRSAQLFDNQSACEKRLLRLASVSSANGSSRHSLRARLVLNIGSM
jgi:hypothetical protein